MAHCMLCAHFFTLRTPCSLFNFKLRMMSEVHSFQMKKSSQCQPIWTPHCPSSHLSKPNLQRTSASSPTTFLTSGWLQSILPRFWILGDRDLFGEPTSTFKLSGGDSCLIVRAFNKGVNGSTSMMGKFFTAGSSRAFASSAIAFQLFHNGKLWAKKSRLQDLSMTPT